MPYILFVLILSVHSAPTLTTQEFDSKIGCDHAAQTLVGVFRTQDVDRSTVWCVPKNGVDY